MSFGRHEITIVAAGEDAQLCASEAGDGETRAYNRLHLEELHLAEVKKRGDEIRGDTFALGAVLADISVKEAASGLDAIFGDDEFVLEFAKAFVGFECRIVLDGD